MASPVVVVMDGSTNVSTAALLAQGPAGGWCVLARRADLDGRGQARVLLRLVDDMLTETARGPENVGAVVVGVGPGTFTGVRIAVATARALALALGVPVLGVSTLAALAAEALFPGTPTAGCEPDLIVPVVDARRGQVFYGLYRRVLGGSAGPVGGQTYVRTEPFAVCDRDALVSSLPSGATTHVVGDVGVLERPEGGTVAGDTVMLQALEVRAEHLVIGQDRLDEPHHDVAGARVVRRLDDIVGADCPPGGLRAGELGSPEGVKPIYVRSPDADIHITKMRDPWAETVPEG